MSGSQSKTAGKSAAKTSDQGDYPQQRAGEDSEDKTSKPPSSDGKPSGKKKRGTGPSKGSGTRTDSASTASSNTQGGTFSEGEKALLSYGLSVSGRKERVISDVKTEKFFHLIEQSWRGFVDAKPEIKNRFSYAEFRHASALMLYNRLEQVKFEGIGVRPLNPVRVPLPRNLRVYQPIWAMLSEFGIVEDDDLRVTYIPQGVLPVSENLTDSKDAEGLIACTLYDWVSSWEEVIAARGARPTYADRYGYDVSVDSNETPKSRQELVEQIAALRTVRAETVKKEQSSEFTVVKGVLQKVMYRTGDDGNFIKDKNGQFIRCPASSYEGVEGEQTVADIDAELAGLHLQAKRLKKELITLKFETKSEISCYTIEDEVVQTGPGAHGTWLRWDPQLWLEYEQMVEMILPVALFSLSMPVETRGTYAWIIPVESREDDENSVFCRLPKASIPPVTWVKAMLLQSSTLPFHRRSTWYCETDTLSNVAGLRRKFVIAGIKRAGPIEQYGTY